MKKGYVDNQMGALQVKVGTVLASESHCRFLDLCPCFCNLSPIKINIQFLKYKTRTASEMLEN